MGGFSAFLNLCIVAGFIYIGMLEAPAPRLEKFSGKVTFVTDGDTFRVEDHAWPVRIWGVDAPEKDTTDGPAATAFLEGFIKEQTVTCEKVVIDKFKRTVAKCQLHGVDLGRLILQAGHGTEMCSFSQGFYGRC